MLCKFFNTQLINAGMPREIRGHMMGHKLKDGVREAYFLADPDELRKIYLMCGTPILKWENVMKLLKL